MKLAVISDIHGNRLALEAVLADVQRHGVDATVALGDYLSGPLDPLGAADLLIERGLLAVCGNHDRHITAGRDADWEVDAWVRERLVPRQRDWLASLPATAVLEGMVFLCHGTPADDDTLWLDGVTGRGIEQKSRAFIEAQAAGIAFPVLLCGHSHVPRLLRLADGRLVVNPGSVGLPLGLGLPDARYAVIEKLPAGWSASLHAVPYDHAAAAAQAQDFGFENWARAVSTGWSTPFEL